jgi:hypothetical protein
VFADFKATLFRPQPCRYANVVRGPQVAARAVGCFASKQIGGKGSQVAAQQNQVNARGDYRCRVQQRAVLAAGEPSRTRIRFDPCVIKMMCDEIGVGRCKRVRRHVGGRIRVHADDHRKRRTGNGAIQQLLAPGDN